MYKIKVLIKTSIKKLKKLSLYKGKSLFFCLNSLTKENNPNFSIIVKKLKILINDIEKKAKNEIVSNKLMEKIYICTILLSPSKKLKRINIRAKGRADTIEKRNTYVTMVLNKKNTLTNKNAFFIKKNYKIKY